MLNSTFEKINLFRLIFLLSLFFISTQTRAQFPYSESFKNTTAPGISFGGTPTAFLTAPSIDVNGNGYLRLTNNNGNQKGIIWSDSYAFPSAYGLNISFEYYTYGGNGADGIAFVLFDATVASVVPGAFGGSLGYAQRNTETGFPGGYLGIGIDEYGNFSANNEGKLNGAGMLPSNITLRGQGSGTTGYPYLTHSQTTSLSPGFNVAGGNRAATTSASAGFRKVNIKLSPRSMGGFFITVSVTNGSTSTTIINNYAYTTASPPNLKFALTSSTGGSNNYHEIRNLDISVDSSTLLTPVANADTFVGCKGASATSGDITSNDNGTVNTLGTTNKASVDLDPSTTGIQNSFTVANKGTFTYDAATGRVTFNPIDASIVGPIAINYTFNDTYGKTSNSSTITYNVYTPITNNTITAPGTTAFCGTSGNAANIVGSTAGGGTGVITYQWQSSLDNIAFNSIGVTTESYDPPAITATTYYRRVAISSGCQDISNVVKITIDSPSSNTTSTAAICETGTKTLVGSPIGGTWSIVAGGGTISGNVYTPANIAADTNVTVRYTRSAGSCGTASSADATFLVNYVRDVQNTTSTTSICECTTKSLTANISGGTWSIVSGGGSISGNTYTPANVSIDTRVTVRYTLAGNGACGATTSDVSFTVNVDSDNDGVADVADLDDDNDGILDTVECPASTTNIAIDGLTFLSGSGSASNINVGDYLLKSNAVNYLGVTYDMVIKILSMQVPTGKLDITTASPAGTLQLSDAIPNENPYVTYSMTMVRSGSATAGNPLGAPAPIGKLWVTVADLDGNGTGSGNELGDVGGYSSSLNPEYLIVGSNLSNLGFMSGGPTGFNSFRPTLIPGINASETDLTYAYQASFTSYTTGEFVFGITGSRTGTVSRKQVLSLRSEYACDRDGDGIPNQLDLDSDGDSCSDANEYYNSRTADGNDGGVYGTGTPVVNSNGTVQAATYSGSYVNPLSPGTASTVGTHPSNQTASATGTASFSVAVSGGSGTTQYQWQVSTDNGASWNAITNGSTYSNVNTANLSLTAITCSMNNYRYRALITQSDFICGNVSSNSATLTVSNPTALSLTGSTICASPGNNGAITSGTSVTGINYQLYNSSNTAVQSAKAGTGASLSWTGLAGANGYYVIGTNATTGCFSTSNVVNVAVNATPATPIVTVVDNCDGTSTLSTTASGTLLWSTGASTSSITVSTAGTYTVTATVNGCTSAAGSGTAAPKATPATPLLSIITQPICGTSTGSFAITNYNSSYTYNITPSGASLNTSTGVITAQKGTYTVSSTFNGCTSSSSAAVTINSEICANDDNTFAVQTPGTISSTTVGNITTNDTLDGIAVTSSNTDVTPVTNGPLSIDSDGVLTLAPNTVSGTYSITYQLCETGLNSGNCDTAQATVTVKRAIDAVTETTASINGNTGGTTVSLTANDTLNGNIVVIGANPGEVTLNSTGSLPIGLTLNANGTVTIAPNTPTGNYNVEYTICEVGSVPANCDTTISVVTVVAPAIDAVTETTASINGNTGGNTASLTANDTLNGNPVVIGTSAGQVKLTGITVPPGLTLNADGTVTVAPNTPSGNYNVEYSICEITNPTNCDTVVSIVTVGAPTIDAVTETTVSINGNTGGTTAPLTTNDTLNGNPVVIGTSAGQVKLTEINVPSGLTLNADGTVTVAPNTPSGNYNVEYSICEITNPTNCDTATSIITVGVPTIDAVTETTASINGNTGGTTGSLTENDTLNGNPVVIGTSAGQVKLTEINVPSGLTLNADGTVTVAPNTTSGNYNVEYSICEITNSTNCDTVVSIVTVGAPTIDAVTETTVSINGNTGGTTAPLTTNDTLNGNPVVIGTSAGQVKLTEINVPSGLTLNADGTVTVAPNTPSGNYNVEYSICEITNPTNCDTATSVVQVSAGNLVANTDAIPSVIGTSNPQTLGVNVFDNDTKNGLPLVPSDVTLTTSTPDPKGYLTLNPDGTVTLGANPPAGTYELTYTICEKLNPSNCSSNTVSVIVGMPIIDAVTETTASVNGNTGGTTASLAANDTLNGNPVVIGTSAGQVKLTGINVPSGLTLNADGTVTVAPNTPSGNYNVEYSICEITNPSNCDTVVSVVQVSAGNLVANTDAIPSVIGTSNPQTLGVNVFDNDTKNGLPLVPSDVTLTTSTPDAKGYLTLNPDGTVTLGANPPAGTYELAYTICEKLNPSNCSSNTVSVTVGMPIIDAVTETTVSINGNTGGTTGSLTENDTLNGNPVVIGTSAGQVKLTGITVPPGLTLNADGTVTVAPNTPSGHYNVEYSICEITNPTNCDTVVSVVQVSAGNLVANTDAIPSVIGTNNPQTLSVNVFDNDTKNGLPLVPSDVTLTTSTPDAKGYLTLNADGTVTLGANPPAGTYELEYTICEKLNPSNCTEAIVKVVVITSNGPSKPNQITLVNDTNISVDGINGALEFVNVLDNDLINGQPINPATVKVSTLTPNAYFEWNTDGTVNVKPNTPGGNYTLTYEVCDKVNSLNCATAVVNVFVEVPAIAVVKTALFNDENASGFANSGETITYKFTVTNTGNVPLKGITLKDPLTGVVVSGSPIDLDVNESNDSNFTAVYKITQEDINRGSITNQASVSGNSARGVMVEDLSDDSTINGDKPTVLELNGCVIKVFNAFSPNGDAKNARFYIQGIECYPDNTVEIYNRWGVLVFNMNRYNNEDRVFVGFSEGRTTIKQTDGLPVGTYFYILKYKDSSSKPHEQSGYLYINK
ncbi:T9SS type B sorting domain-containing protein [Flavobacterium foetidum]|uniref:T9SS type B sorting domain-containing protein n=1 Tax=Flavobacterium foetidum TaxID=2026681 RepID=UPI0010752076|nr:gliding motility-associated C-terminal domain-containing protein [Flavobacterium foetidum]KAF2511958.1 hypothetical protein E0W73_16670 [Flavobacterium foetidum]